MYVFSSNKPYLAIVCNVPQILQIMGAFVLDFLYKKLIINHSLLFLSVYLEFRRKKITLK